MSRFGMRKQREKGCPIGSPLRRKDPRNCSPLNRTVLVKLLAVVSCLVALAYAVLVQQMAAQTGSANVPLPARTGVNFDMDIAPIFRASCNGCHGPAEPKAQLRLDSEAAVLQGGVSGSVIKPGNSQDSLLVKRLLGLTDAPRMPLSANALSKQQIDLIRAWIDQVSSVRSNVSVSPATIESQASHSPGGKGVDFASNIRPILAARCYQCHGPDVQQNGLRLDSLSAALRGSASRKVIIAGDGEKSILVRRLLGLNLPRMPYGGPPLSSEQINLIRHWIDRGAPGPDSAEPIVAAKPVKHWAFMKPVRPPVPAVKNVAWSRN